MQPSVRNHTVHTTYIAVQSALREGDTVNNFTPDNLEEKTILFLLLILQSEFLTDIKRYN